MHKNNLAPDTNLGKQIYLSTAGKGLKLKMLELKHMCVEEAFLLLKTTFS